MEECVIRDSLVEFGRKLSSIGCVSPSRGFGRTLESQKFHQRFPLHRTWVVPNFNGFHGECITEITHGCCNSSKEGCFPIHVPPWFWKQALPSKLPAACPYLRYLILCFNITPFAATAWRPHPAGLICSKCLRFADRPPGTRLRILVYLYC